MIDHKIERKLYSFERLDRVPHKILLIKQEDETVGQLTIKSILEENLWREAVKQINEVLQKLNKS